MSTRSEHPIFSTLYDWIMQPQDWLGFAEQRARTASGAHGRTLELGAGTGLNFRFYGAAVSSLVAVEPDPVMLRQAVQRAAAMHCPAYLVLGDGQRLPFADRSFDSVVATLVFCTIPDATRALDELQRVLKPGGKLYFFEHVRTAGFGARVQDTITPLWRHIAGGCNLNRKTLETFTRSGLTVEQVWQRGMIVQGTARFARG